MARVSRDVLAQRNLQLPENVPIGFGNSGGLSKICDAMQVHRGASQGDSRPRRGGAQKGSDRQGTRGALGSKIRTAGTWKQDKVGYRPERHKEIGGSRRKLACLSRIGNNTKRQRHVAQASGSL